jgi:hypothetical protein
MAEEPTDASSPNWEATRVRCRQFVYSEEGALVEASHFDIDREEKSIQVQAFWKQGQDASGARSLLEAQAQAAEVADSLGL